MEKKNKLSRRQGAQKIVLKSKALRNVLRNVSISTHLWRNAFEESQLKIHPAQIVLWPSGMHMCSYAFSDDDNYFHATDDFVNISSPAFYTLICTGSAITFAIFSYMVEYRFYHVSVSGVYEKHRGYSFHLALAGSLLYIVALLLSIPSTVYVIRRDSQLVRANEQNRMVLAAGGDKTSPKQESDLCEESSTFGMPYYSQEEQFALRSLPSIPRKNR
ncbi:Clc-like protein [Ancylostoma ceylanicum]|uniref:Clc-like protein n=1 Tax=Ancylostoma ceylanicum TaxID=53326 RepID=A0A0D6LL59_9BILA|nr:Clc-like protein [Ancylostoma ceylanicum]